MSNNNDGNGGEASAPPVGSHHDPNKENEDTESNASDESFESGKPQLCVTVVSSWRRATTGTHQLF